MVTPGDSDSAHGRSGLRICSRLRHFLSLDPAKVFEEVEAEAEKLAAAEAALERARRELAKVPRTEKLELERAAEKVRRLADSIFRPYSSGIYIASPRFGKPSLQRLFGSENVYSVLITSEAACSAIARAGLRVGSRSGDVTTALATRGALLALADSHVQGEVRLARAWAPALLDVVDDADIDLAQTNPPASTTPAGTYLGEGILIGAVDSWFDLHHQDFCSAGGGTRIVAYWDQLLTLTGAGTLPPALGAFMPSPPGVVFSQADIDNELAAATVAANAYTIVPCVPPLTDGVLSPGAAHGTQVLGAAGGNGRSVALFRVQGGRPGPAPAPAADLVLVRALTVSGSTALCDEALILGAVDYCFQLAGTLSQPCIVNLSLTDNRGGHDGLSEGELHLDSQLQTPTRVLTLAAGNATGTNSHAHGSVVAGALPTQLVLEVGPSFANPDSVEIWYDGQESFDFELWYDAPPPPLPTPPPATIHVVTATSLVLGVNAGAINGVTISVEHELQQPSGDNRILVQFDTALGTLPAGKYTFALYASSVVNPEFDAWIDRNNPIRLWKTFLDDSQKTLGVPASCMLAIAAGNHAKGVNPGVLDTSSGLGYTRDGRVKPDITAAGVTVWVPTASNRQQPVVEHYKGASGTSISAPIVAGSCALLFQRGRMTATCGDLRQILIDLARAPGGVVPKPPPSVGWGDGSLYLGDGAVTAVPKVDVWLRDDGPDDGSEPFTREIFWRSPDIELLDAAGALVTQPTYLPGQRFSNRVRVTVRNRGASPALNTQVFLYWTDPATDIPFPSAWRTGGIYAGAAPGFVDETNCIVIPKLGAAGTATSSTQVEFAWSAPEPGTNLAGNDHFCLLVRLENPSDQSGIAAGGFTSVVQTNNIGLHNVHVIDGSVPAPMSMPPSPQPQPGPPPGPPWKDSRFTIRGQGRRTDVRVWSEGFEMAYELVLPVGVLPWGDPDVLAQTGGKRPLFPGQGFDPLKQLTAHFDPEQAEDLAGICGVESLTLQGGYAVLLIAPGAEACLHELRLGHGVAAQARIRVRADGLSAARGSVHVGQISDGRRVGGVTIEVRS